MTLSTTAARVMSLAHEGRVHAALVLGRRALETVAESTATEQAGLWYAIAAAEHMNGDHAGALNASERCLALALEADDAGWASNGLSLRAMASARLGRMEPALLDLARAEVELGRCTDDALACWAHTGLGYCYLELRLYELAAPHLERAQVLDASPIPLAGAPVIDLTNLVELHLRWADELERVHPFDGSDDEVVRHRKEGHTYAERALAVALELGEPSSIATCRGLELCSRPRGTAESSLPELREAFASTQHPEHQGGRATVGGALARALWSLGERDEAVEVAREAARYSEAAGDWQVAASAGWLLVEMQAQAGVPGAASGRAYAQLLSQVLWQQRLSTLQGAQAALDVERLHRDNLAAHRVASEDPLTGVGNRRAIDEALRAVQVQARGTRGDQVGPETPMSLLVVDLDDFKKVNDTYGHVVGDDVLRAVATAVRSVARADDVVARLGGDEFVVLARGADEATGAALARRVTAAVEALEVGTSQGTIRLSASVGVATTGTGVEIVRLLAEADAEMYRIKALSRPRRDESATA